MQDKTWKWHLVTGLLEPLPIGAANFRERLDGLLVAMGADILGRVMGDKMEEDRCFAASISLKTQQPAAYPSLWFHAMLCLTVLACVFASCGMTRVWCFRWPQKFELQMRAFRNSDRKSKTAVRSCSFPSPALLAAADSSAGFNAETGSGENLQCDKAQVWQLHAWIMLKPDASCNINAASSLYGVP